MNMPHAMNSPKPSPPAPLVRWALLCAVLAVAGCNLIPPALEDPTRYYVLSDSSPAAGAQAGAKIGIDSVRLEGYLKRREMVVRTGANEVEFKDYRRWAEPLDAAITRVVRSSLLASAGVAQAWLPPFPVDQDRDFDVSIEVTRCEGAATGSGKYVASLSAVIEISTSGTSPHLVTRRLFTAPDEAWDGRDFDRLAALLSIDAAALGRDVLAGIPPKS